jgi:membrane protease YdiL (CAAX protease family)
MRRERRPVVVLIALASLAGCSRPLAQARTEKFQPPMPAEQSARARLSDPVCNPRLGSLFPGGAQICTGEPRTGAAIAAVAAAELTTGISVAVAEDADHPGALLPLLGFSDLWVYSAADFKIEQDLARELRFAPQDSAADLVAAPFNWQVMKRPDVVGGLVAILAAGIGVSLLVDEEIDRDNAGTDPNLFGRTFDRRIGYPLGYAAEATLFYQVAMAEEAAFRGWVQSSLARRHGETAGWIEGSLIFGAVHAPNIFFMPQDQWRDYLLIGVPFITALGSYIGWVYKRSGYSLAPAAALHFWYDFLLSATFFTLDPDGSPLSANLTWRF